MKAREAARITKYAEAVGKIAAMVKAGKTDRAMKSLASLQDKMEAIAKGAKKAASRPANGYAKFVKDNYKKVAAKTGKTFAEVTKILAKMYKEQKAEKNAKKSAPKKAPAKKAPAKKAAPKKKASKSKK